MRSCNFLGSRAIEAKGEETMNNLVKLNVSFEYNPKVYLRKRKTGWHWKFKLPNGLLSYGRVHGETEQVVRKNVIKKEKQLAKGFFTKKEIAKLKEVQISF